MEPSQIIPESLIISISKFGASAILAIAAAVLAYWRYRKEKEYDLVRKRYLEDGLDLLIQSIESTMGVYHQNRTWAYHCLETSSEDQVIDIYEQVALLPLDPSILSTTPIYRVNILINDKEVLFKTLPRFYVFLRNAYISCQSALELGRSLRDETGSKVDRSRITQREELSQIHEQFTQYHRFLFQLQELAKILEKEKFTFRKIGRFYKRPRVRTISCNLAAISSAISNEE